MKNTDKYNSHPILITTSQYFEIVHIYFSYIVHNIKLIIICARTQPAFRIQPGPFTYKAFCLFGQTPCHDKIMPFRSVDSPYTFVSSQRQTCKDIVLVGILHFGITAHISYEYNFVY